VLHVLGLGIVIGNVDNFEVPVDLSALYLLFFGWLLNSVLFYHLLAKSLVSHSVDLFVEFF